MAKSFDFEAAKQAGYSDDEINSFIQKSHPSFDVNAARNAGYSSNEINSFLAKTPPKQEGIRGELERKVAAPLTEFALRAATSIPDTAKGLEGLAQRGINTLLQKMGAKGLSEEELKAANMFASRLSPLGSYPDTDQISNILKQVTGGRLEPTTPAEKVLKKGAGIAGSVAGFGPGAALGTPLKAAGTLAMAGTTAALEEEGVNPWVATGAGIVADLLTKGFAGLGKKLAGAFSKGTTETAGTLAGKAAKLTPAEIKQEVVDAAQRIGIQQGEIPLSAQLKSPAVQSVETKLRESSLAGRSLEKQLANVESKTRTAYEDISNQISTRQEALPGVVAEEAITQLKKIEKDATDGYTKLYKQAEQQLPKGAVSDQASGRNILKHLESQIEKLGRGSGTPAKDAIKNRLVRLSNDWKARFSDGKIPIQDLTELKQDLHQIIKYEVKGGVDKSLNPLLHMTKNAIQRYGMTNPGYAFRFNEAERLFADSARTFRKNEAVASLLATQNPQQIIQKMKNVKTYRELKKIFDTTPEGRKGFEDLSRYLFEDIIGSKMLNKEGQVSWGNASAMMKNPKNREIVQEIIGKQNFDKLKDIRKFSAGIEEGLRKFANSSGTATKGLDIALILGSLGKGIAQLFSGQVIRGGKTMSYILVPSVMAKLMSNPKFIQAMVDTAHAGRGSNPNLFFEAAKEAMKFIAPAVIESYSSDSEENNQEED